MNIIDGLKYINNSSIALGFFDGIHLGHRIVLKNAIHIAQKNNTSSTVIVFKEHPLNYLTNQKVPLILSFDEKMKMLESVGIDNVVLLDFEKYSGMSAKDYLEQVLVKYFSPIAITTGFNHCFGYKKQGNSEFLRQNKTKYNYEYYEVPPCVVENTVVSCSSIRNKLNLGDFLCANDLLGYKYFIEGTVIQGDKIASKMSFPSANINYPEEKVKIPEGVYFVLVTIDGKEYNGVLNHGYAPTFNNESKLKTEVHILDFNNDIYGEKIKVSFVTKIRNQIKFDNVEKLKAQINRDIAFVEIYKYFLHEKVYSSCKNFYM